MADAPEEGEDERPRSPDGEGRAPPESSEEAEETLRDRVETKYDFDDFGPADMAEMTVEEWEAAFDPETWITGTELLDRVEADLKSKVASREVFALVERLEEGGDRVLAYSDEGYAIVHPDGSVEGEGSVRRDVEPVVALCSMEEYDPSDPPEGDLLPDPADVESGSSELGNLLVQVVAGIQLLAGVFLLVSPLLFDVGGGGSVLLTTVIGLLFVAIGVVLLVLVANARLSDRFRAEEYRERLLAMGAGTDERPEFVPVGDDGEDPET